MKKEHKPYYEKLLKKKDEFLRRFTNGTELVREETAANSGDMVDQATDDYQKEFLNNLSESDLDILRKIDKAIKKIEEGGATYGVCEETGEPINPKRLMAVPWAEYCLEVQERIEKEGKLI